ncbi:hypothetical protein, partial [Streptococcus danieliae]|uniref:hypothetical protein n=1 Tax=Streptococcus danieliae TaxID=747656 RepID=UPI001C54D0F9
RGLFTMGKTNTRALSLKKPPRFKASCLQSWRFFDIPCYWALTNHQLKTTFNFLKKHPRVSS